MVKFLIGFKDGWIGGRHSAGKVDQTLTKRISGGNAAASFVGTNSYQKLIEAAEIHDAKVRKFFKVNFPIIVLTSVLLTLIPFTYQDYTLWGGISQWLMMMLAPCVFVILLLTAWLFPSSDKVEQVDIEAVVVENKDKLRDFYSYYVNNKLNDGQPSNEKVIIKPTNFKASATTTERLSGAVTKNHKIKLVGMYQIEDKLTVITVLLKFSEGYKELYALNDDLEVFEAA